MTLGQKVYWNGEVCRVVGRTLDGQFLDLETRDRRRMNGVPIGEIE